MNLDELAQALWQTNEEIADTATVIDRWRIIATAAQRLLAPVSTDVFEGQMREASAHVQEQLGGQVVSESETSFAPTPEGVGPRAAATRVAASRRALTATPRTLTRGFNPRSVGYTRDDLQRDYPNIEPGHVLESFLSHHIAKGDVSKNWLEKFFSYCANAQRIETERLKDKTATDSMGLPLDPQQRMAQRRAEQEHYREEEEFHRQAIESEQP